MTRTSRILAGLRSRPKWLLGALAFGLHGCGSSSSPAPSISTQPPPEPVLSGLDARPSNLTCIAPARQAASLDVELAREYASLDFSQPLAMLQAPGDSSRWFVLEKTGRVRVFDADPATQNFLADFIDLSLITNLNTSSEGGLLGMAFHPDYAVNGEVFVSWTEGSPMTSVIARFTVNAGGLTLDSGTREDLVRLEQDYSNHNGGNIAFGPDGYLYIGFGDGGSGGDPLSRAQETRNLLGAMLRIDVDSGLPYGIPSNNPFSGNATCPSDPDILLDHCPEIFAWGLRNPWRFSFDSATGDLWVGDVGQNAWEEIDLVERGGNYGWDCREGANDFGAPASSCDSVTGLVDPVHEYPHADGVSVTGGFVYRGTEVPALVGSYVFADYGSGRVWRLIDDGSGGLTGELLLETGLAIASFGQSNDGALYVIDIVGGGLHRMVPGSGGSSAATVPDRLSATGCFQASNPAQPADGLIPYTVSAPFWSDGAEKERWLAIPDGTRIDVQADGDFSFPPGFVLAKQFRLNGELIETRLLMRHPDGVWAGYSYEWDQQLNDGVLLHGGKVADVGGQNWHFPSSAQCSSCHTAAAGHALGPETLQLNGEVTYPSTGRTANQLTTLDDILVLQGALVDPVTSASLVDPYASGASIQERARSYLHTNCSQCHRPSGPAPTTLDFRFGIDLAQTNACDQPPQ
ncbi:MAG: PQQ-dependent sugar dehydrogenase, partial [Gammaproteobacteria bacterium]